METFELTIDELAYEGFGVGRHQNMVVFVPYSAPGDRIEVTPVKRKKRFIEARIVKIIEPSRLRTSPECPYFGDCGGCQWRHVRYDAQLKAKASQVSSLLERFAGVVVPDIEVQASPVTSNYRIRARFHASLQGLGFQRLNSHEAVPLSFCPSCSERLNELLRYARGIPEFSRVSQVQAVDGDIQLLVNLSARPSTALFELARRIKKDLGAVVFVNNRPTSPKRYVSIKLPFGPPVRYSPGMFIQTNPHINQLIVLYVLSLIPRSSRILELYAGVGNFTCGLAEVTRITAVEGSRASCGELKRRCKGRSAEVVCGPARRALEGMDRKFDAILVDPPRKGLEEEVVSWINQSDADTLCYVSCNPATLARDIKRLAEAGWSLESIKGFDMFPYTYHVETVSVLKR